MSLFTSQIDAATTHLLKNDPVLRPIIEQWGPMSLNPEKNYFHMLVRSIISQQISTSAARSIRKKVESLFSPGRLTAERLSLLTVEELRKAGVSSQKGRYLLDLASKVQSGTVRLRGITCRTDEEIIQELTQVKGIGVWTAQMFLIFGLGRLDVLPHDDLGVRVAMKNLYQLNDLPDKSLCNNIARKWRPYATVGSWYCWRSLELKK